MGRLNQVAQVVMSAALVLAPQWAQAYTATLSLEGRTVRWQGAAKIHLAGNSKNLSGIAAPAFFDSVTRGLQRWKDAAGGSVDFDYWQGVDASIYEPSSDYNGLSSVYFASASQVLIDPNVLGLTQVWFDTRTGQILETDIVLNDRHFLFSDDPEDTTGYGGGGVSGNGRTAFLENVLTHELGHAFGLSHSGTLQSTMLFMESPQQFHLSCDDRVGLRALYPATDAPASGAITGQVVGENGAPVFGAQVVAISQKRGTVLASALTGKLGEYSIAALEPGAYFLMVEPFYAGARALPGFYQGSSSELCDGQNFGRSFLTEENGRSLQAVTVASGASGQAPILSARCSLTGGASVISDPASAAFRTAPSAAASENGFGVVDRFTHSDVLYFRFQSVGGRVEIHALAYGLYSPVRTSLRLLDSNGRTISARVEQPVFSGESGFQNYDSQLVAEGLADGEYVVRVSATGMNSSQYPAGPVSLDPSAFVVVTGSMNQDEPELANSLPVNARCEAEDSAATYLSPPGNPPRFPVQVGNEQVGFCGTVSSADSGGAGPGAASMIGWFAPWLFMASSGFWASRRQRLRSAVGASLHAPI